MKPNRPKKKPQTAKSEATPQPIVKVLDAVPTDEPVAL